MSKEGKFMVFCIEQYKAVKKLTGKEVMTLFSQYGIMEYLYTCYEALHTTGINYIIEDIDEYIKVRQN